MAVVSFQVKRTARGRYLYALPELLPFVQLLLAARVTHNLGGAHACHEAMLAHPVVIEVISKPGDAGVCGHVKKKKAMSLRWLIIETRILLSSLKHSHTYENQEVICLGLFEINSLM